MHFMHVEYAPKSVENFIKKDTLEMKMSILLIYLPVDLGRA